MKPTTTPKAPARGKADRNRYPKGVCREKVKEIIAYYENPSDEDAIAEAEAAYRSNTTTMMAVPVELVPVVEKMIAKRAGQ